MHQKNKNVYHRKGSATKEQVAGMLQNLLKIKEMPKHLDASDGLAAAVCHFFKRLQWSLKHHTRPGHHF